MIKRVMDIIISLLGLIILSPVLLVTMFLIWKVDNRSPFYVAVRVGKNGKPFKMVKLRSMIVDAENSGVFSSSDSDDRITPVGYKIRKYKLDEFVQLWNVLIGDMSLVGPRPNVKEETNLYTNEEEKLLVVKPGITDFSSIVFSDEGNILKGKNNPDLMYNQLIRPWKSRLGLIYIENQSFILDLKIIIFTLVAIFLRKTSLNWISKELIKIKVDKELIEIVKREKDLYPFPPPGMNTIVKKR